MRNKSLKLAIFALIFMLSQAPAFAQSLEFPNNFTPDWTVPSGCLLLTPALFQGPSEVFYDETVQIEGIFGSAPVRILAWRIGCHEPGRSAIAVNFRVPDQPTSLIPVPLTFLSVDGVSPPVAAPLSLFSAMPESGILQQSTQNLTAIANRDEFARGVTYIVLGESDSITPEEYNGPNALIMNFFPTPSGEEQQVVIPIFSYIPELDPTQLPDASFHGRYSGLWTLEGDLPRSGLLLQVGEIPGSTRNFMFAIWFTYLNGFPTWVTGNTDFEIGDNEIEIDMITLEGGEFFTQPGSFTNSDLDVTQLGTMTIRANHCNEIEADNDFTASGLGTSSLTFGRLIRIAGYDCDQTQ